MRSPLHSLSRPRPTHGYTLVPSPKNGLNVPSFLIDMIFDEVSQTGVAVLLYLVPVLLNLVPVPYPYWANTTVQHGQNSVKQCKQCQTECQRLHGNSELHQKDLRIIALFLHISGSRNKGNIEADTFLALSLIVAYSVSQAS